MSGFAGFSDYQESLRSEKYLWKALARRMAARVAHRGPDDAGTVVSDHCALGHARLAVIDPAKGVQPFSILREGHRFTIAYNGEIYNAPSLRRELAEIGYRFETHCDTEVVLTAYLHYGPACVTHFIGMFAFVVDDPLRRQTVLCRDPLGVKPLFYSFSNGRLVFGSEIKALFEYPGINPVIDRTGLCEVLGLGPVRTPGFGVFAGIHELLPGNLAVFNGDGFRQQPYFSLQAVPHIENYEDTVARVRTLLLDTVHQQLAADAPLCVLLPGCEDAGTAAAIAAQSQQAQGRELIAYSLQFPPEATGTATPSFVEGEAKAHSGPLGPNQHPVPCSAPSLLSALYDGVIAKDLPGKTWQDGALLYFCRKLKAHHTVAFCGAGADALFGGYSWFHKPGSLSAGTFPWSPALRLRNRLLKPALREALALDRYVSQRFTESLSLVPVLQDESDEEHHMRTLSFLSIQQVAAATWDSLDRCGMASGVEIRTPYANHHLAQYVFNVPWDFKAPHGIPKGLLHDAASGFLLQNVHPRPGATAPPSVVPPGYDALLQSRLLPILRDSAQPLYKIFSKAAVTDLFAGRLENTPPGLGQPMPDPALLADLLQLNFWLQHYNIYLDL